ncbi:Hypothetical protein CINCED_3A005259 [Cinara cedri]|uniref:Nuclear transport factor 2, eukaryote,NTF2-like domain n=1 Tax=Cinara cedri TaxID=506608 RepID=A0A5E4NTN7_9HEMI|nr:Hypothetical protein CINCED_3A005259 [Cinara cedri]
MDDPLTITENAAIIGFGFAKDYYTVLRRKPQCVDEFYDAIGEYKTVFEDGTIVLARTRQEAKKVLLGPVYEPRLIVNSIITVPCGGSLNRMMITVSGRSFTTVFITELRPERPLTYVIVSSLTRQFSAAPGANRQTMEMRFAAGDGPANTGVDRMAMDGLKPKVQVGYAHSLTTLCTTVPEITQSDIAAKILQHILLHIPPPEIISSDKPSSNNHATKNLLQSILNNILPHIPPPEIEPSSPNIATGNVHPDSADKFLPLEIIKPVPNTTEVSIFRKPLPDNLNHNMKSGINSEKLMLRILTHTFLYKPLPIVQISRNVPSSLNTETGYTHSVVSIKNPPARIPSPVSSRITFRSLLLYHYYVGRYDNV